MLAWGQCCDILHNCVCYLWKVACDETNAAGSLCSVLVVKPNGTIYHAFADVPYSQINLNNVCSFQSVTCSYHFFACLVSEWVGHLQDTRLLRCIVRPKDCGVTHKDSQKRGDYLKRIKYASGRDRDLQLENSGCHGGRWGDALWVAPVFQVLNRKGLHIS